MKNKRRSGMRIETIIIFIIAACMIFLIDFTHDKLNDFARLEQEALLVNHDPNNPIHEELAKEIMQYRPGAYKMIEIYRPDLEIMMTLQFSPDETYETNLNDHPDLVELFHNNEEGHTQVIVDDKEEDIYFRWTDGANGEKFLIVVYSSRHPVKNLGVFSFVCYLVLLLVFLLLIRLHINHYNDKIKQYKNMSDDVRNRVLH